jgi:hypothetical protein
MAISRLFLARERSKLRECRDRAIAVTSVDPIWRRGTISRRATVLEGLDDDQAAVAARTRLRECLRLTAAGAIGITELILRCLHVEQLTRSPDVLGAPAVGEQTVRTWMRKRRMHSSMASVITLARLRPWRGSPSL